MHTTNTTSDEFLLAESTTLPLSIPVAELPQASPVSLISLVTRIANLIAVIVPLAALVLGIFSIWGRGFSWVNFILLGGIYVITVLGKLSISTDCLLTIRLKRTT